MFILGSYFYSSSACSQTRERGFYNENAGKIDNEEFGTPGMFKLFQKFQTLLDRKEKPAPEEAVFTADVAQEMPGWALSMQSQLDEISTAMRGEGVTRRYSSEGAESSEEGSSNRCFPLQQKFCNNTEYRFNGKCFECGKQGHMVTYEIVG